jgi:hypothetical protein
MQLKDDCHMINSTIDSIWHVFADGQLEFKYAANKEKLSTATSERGHLSRENE